MVGRKAAARRASVAIQAMSAKLGDETVREVRFHAAIGALLSESDGTNGYAHAGIGSERGFLAGVGVMFVLNLSVSFVLSVTTAARHKGARRLPPPRFLPYNPAG